MPRMYKCPNCGTLNAEGVPPFPLCSKCGTNLVCCRYCRFFNPKTAECMHPLQMEIQVITDPDTIPSSCDLFRSRLIVGEERLRRKVARTLGISAAATAVLLLLIWGLFLRGGPTREWELNITFPQQLFRGSYFLLNVQLNNTGKQPLENLALRFPYAFFTNFSLQSTAPMVYTDVRGDSFYFWLPTAIAPGQSFTLQIYLLPLNEGTFTTLCELLSGAKPIDSRFLRFRIAAPSGTLGTLPATPR
ncbi:MAG: hypothetical protein ACP5KZ_06670 [bacterium]